jgi:hypothetical protein
MMTRSTSLAQQRTQLLAALQRQRADLMTALQNAAMHLAALQQLPGTGPDVGLAKGELSDRNSHALVKSLLGSVVACYPLL